MIKKTRSEVHKNKGLSLTFGKATGLGIHAGKENENELTEA